MNHIESSSGKRLPGQTGQTAGGNALKTAIAGFPSYLRVLYVIFHHFPAAPPSKSLRGHDHSAGRFSL